MQRPSPNGPPRTANTNRPLWAGVVIAALLILVGVVWGIVKVVRVAERKAVDQMNRQLSLQAPPVIPEAKLADATPPGGVPSAGLDNDPFKKAMQDTAPDGANPEGRANKAAPTGRPSSGPSDAGGASDGNARRSDLLARLHKDSVPLAQFGTGSDGAIGPHGPVFGNGGNARQIVFVCDASGSMLNKMASLKNELQKAVDGLKPIQSFNIIFLQDQKCAAFDEKALVPATPDNKRKAFAFLDNVTTSGTTDPMPGLTLAFNQHPQLLYLLTDGDFPDNKAVKDKVAQLNRDHKTKINTIAFVGSTDTETEFLALLESIAKNNGGTYRHIAENELNQ